MHAQPLQMQDDSDDESDPAGNVADEDTANVTTSTVKPTRRTRLTDVKSVCFNRVLMWLWCHAGIHVSVLLAQILSRPWTVAAQYAERHSNARCQPDLQQFWRQDIRCCCD